ncbi:MAG TPA: hypothetical protein VFR15_12750, partial [Chloroflexia bacterium]|nr:hypothetical protein [Chloroflexia bacterium]
MESPHPDEPPQCQPSETLLDRREFIHRAALVALGATLAPLITACDQAGTPSATPSPSPAASTATPAALAEAEATQVPPTATSGLAPTSTEPPVEPSPTTAPTATAEPQVAAPGPHGVALLAGTDRIVGVAAVLDLLAFEAGWLRGKTVALKANFNSADPAPGTTHLDALRALLQRLQD